MIIVIIITTAIINEMIECAKKIIVFIDPYVIKVILIAIIIEMMEILTF